ncbi:hypothetical protein OF83DRAFT_1105186 [Amylostereum chailletii]|nr:hypothetical protein OF83DRAFT_1105186 [Amylostereum chailletii]
MQTSYALIAIYKQRIGALERALREAGTQRQQGRQQRHGPVEHRKLLQRFKQFLANEEKFWTQLVVRYQRQFALTEAAPALAVLNLTPPADADADHDGADNDGHKGGGRPSHFRFPLEPSEPQPPPTPTQRASRLTTLSKALVCLGDLARYREQYQEGNGRRGQDDGSKRGGRNRRQASAETAKAKTHDKARACYERARNLVPDEGNASHQLAILASYQKDTFESLVHYYRALCVRVSYEPAADNMGNVLSKFLSSWKSRRNRSSRAPPQTSEGVPHVKSRINNFKDDVVALHALWRLGTEGMDAVAPNLGEDVVKEFSALVSERFLPVDVVTKVMVLAQGALWKQKLVRAPSTSSSKKPLAPERAAPSPSDIATELRITNHFLSLYRALLDIGTAESKESTKVVEDDLAMRITATFRRTLPALRISGKWLRINLNHVLRGPSDSTNTTALSHADKFWTSYTSFASCMATTFPPATLPRFDIPLEEDVELAGFLPLGGLLGPATARASITESTNGDARQTTSAEPRALEQVHPNEEQLMRIWDIWHDADLVAQTPDVPMHSFRAGSRTFQPPQPAPQAEAVASHAHPVASTEEDAIWEVRPRIGYVDDDARTETTDPVGDAFRKALDNETEDEEQDEIVWNPRPSLSPTSPYKSSDLPVLPSSSEKPINPIGLGRPSAAGINHGLSQQLASTSLAHFAPAPPARSSPVTHTPKTTAQDLLANVMGNRTPSGRLDLRPRRVSHTSPASLLTPTPLPSDPSHPHLLFGGNSTFGSASSIWAASPDEGTLGVHQRHRSHSGPFHPPPSKPPVQPATQPLAQGPWSSQFDHRAMMSQPQGMMPLSIPHSGVHNHNGAHRRTTSTLVGPTDGYHTSFSEHIGQISSHYPAPPIHALSPIGDPSQYAFTTLPTPNTPFSAGPPLSAGVPPLHGMDSRAYQPYGARGFGYNSIGQQKMGGIWDDAG